MKKGADSTRSVEQKVRASIRRRGRGAVFVPTDFLRLGSREAIDVALHRLTREGAIRRLARGLYDLPEEHGVLGRLWPPPERVAEAMAGRDRARLQPAGAYAANLLGLSEQVPAKAVFLTDGPSRTVEVGPMTIQLRHTTPRNMAAAGRLSGLLIQSLRAIGKGNVTPERIQHLKETIPADERLQLLEDLSLAPAWMRPIIRDLAEEQR